MYTEARGDVEAYRRWCIETESNMYDAFEWNIQITTKWADSCLQFGFQIPLRYPILGQWLGSYQPANVLGLTSVSLPILVFMCPDVFLYWCFYVYPDVSMSFCLYVCLGRSVSGCLYVLVSICLLVYVSQSSLYILPRSASQRSRPPISCLLIPPWHILNVDQRPYHF